MTGLASPRPRLPLAAVFLLSAAVLAYEILLLRIFSLTQWHHFAFMVISLALLGYGFSGTILTLLQKPLLARFEGWFVLIVAALAPLAIGSLALALRLEFHPEELIWRPARLARVAAAYLILSLPFCAAGIAVGLALRRAGTDLGRVYGADLAGAGTGSALAVALLLLASPEVATSIVALLAACAAVAASRELGMARRTTLILALLAVLSTSPFLRPNLALSPYKDLSGALLLPGAKVVHHVSGPLGDIRVVENDAVPIRHAPGLSLLAGTGPPPQLAVFQDGTFRGAIARYHPGRTDTGWLKDTPQASAYALMRPDRVLVLGSGDAVLRAVGSAAHSVDVVDINPDIHALLTERFRDYSGRLFDGAGVSAIVRSPRDFASRSGRTYQLVDLGLLKPSATGLHALEETHDLTVEAFRSYLRHLVPGGLLSVSVWNQMPPREELRLFATAMAAGNLADPGRQLAMIRNWQVSTLLIKNGPFERPELDALIHFCERLQFDVVYLPDIAERPANRFYAAEDNPLVRGTATLAGGGRDDFLRRYKFDVSPVDDDRPFFYHFAKWSTTVELLGQRDAGSVALIESGFVVLLVTLVLSAVASLALILMPLAVWRPRATDAAPPTRRTVGLFAALGGAFMFVEIGLIQRFALILGQPVVAVTIVLASMLVFAGVGSTLVSRTLARAGPRRLAAITLIVIAAGISAHAIAGQWLFNATTGWNPAARAALCVILIAPVAIAMGVPFPLALRALERTAADTIPWAWGINGCASVVGAVVATLIAVEIGIVALLFAGLFLYAVAGLSMLRLPHPPGVESGAAGTTLPKE